MSPRDTAQAPHAAIEVRPAEDRAGRRTFVELPFSLYGPGDNWVPPLISERLDHLDPDKNPFFEHAEAALWLAFRGDTCVGRISSQICRLHLERHGDGAGFFGFLEAIDDAEVFRALFETAEGWLRQRGMQRARGPFSFSINDESGLLIDGFDTPPSVFMNHALPYYAPRVEALGYTKAKDLVAYDFDPRDGLPPRARRMLERANKDGSIEVRPLRMKELDAELHLIRDIFNDAWSDNWGFVPLTDAELAELGRNLKMLISEEQIAIATCRGEPVAMQVTLPNINAAIADLNGRLFPFGLVKLWWRLKVRDPESARVTLMGVRKPYQGTLTGAGLMLALIESHRAYYAARNCRTELSWILEDNWPMRRMIEMLGARVYKTYRIYEKAL